MEYLKKIFQIYQLLEQQPIPYFTFNDIFSMKEEERPTKRIGDDLIFYEVYFTDIEYVKKYYKKKYRLIQGKNYKIFREQSFGNGKIIEVPVCVIQNLYNNDIIIKKVLFPNKVVELDFSIK